MVDAANAALKFIGYFRDSWPRDLQEPLSLLADDVYYQGIVPTSKPVRGKAAILQKWQEMIHDYEDQRHTMISVASEGRMVFTERVDECLSNGRWSTIPLVAVFEVDDGKVTAWREYLDPGNIARQLGIDPEKLVRDLDPLNA